MWHKRDGREEAYEDDGQSELETAMFARRASICASGGA